MFGQSLTRSIRKTFFYLCDVVFKIPPEEFGDKPDFCGGRDDAERVGSHSDVLHYLEADIFTLLI